MAVHTPKGPGQLPDEVGVPSVLNSMFVVWVPVKWPSPSAISWPTPFTGASDLPSNAPSPPLLVP